MAVERWGKKRTCKSQHYVMLIVRPGSLQPHH